MILLWVTLLVLNQGNTLVPVTTVQLGERATFSCALPGTDISSTRRDLYWYKQTVGETLKLIVTLRSSAKPEYAAEFSESRLEVYYGSSFSNLTILRTIQEDQGMYHCEIIKWLETPEWSGTYLLLKGNTERTNYAAVQWPAASDPVHPGDSVTLQCSVLSDSENKTCPGEPRVHWFGVRSDESHPNIIYTDGNEHDDECEKRSDTQKSCVYRFSKTVSSSDAGTYYCAVATCGEILFGDGTKLQIGQAASYEFIALVISTVCLVISMIGNIFFCFRTSRPVCSQFKGIERSASQARHDNSSQPVHHITEGEPDLNYTTLHFSGTNATRGRRKKELNTSDSVYSEVKC